MKKALTAKEIIERAKYCKEKNICYISKKPLDGASIEIFLPEINNYVKVSSLILNIKMI